MTSTGSKPTARSASTSSSANRGCTTRGSGRGRCAPSARWLLSPGGPGAIRVITDPIVENLRAVRCYEKAGFRKVRVLPAHEALDGVKRDSWLMEFQPGGAQAGSRP